MYALYPSTIPLTCSCSAASSTKMSASGGGTVFEQKMKGGCCLLLIAATIGKPMSDALVAQPGSTTTVIPVARLMPLANAGMVNAGAATITGAAATCTTPISTPLSPG